MRALRPVLLATAALSLPLVGCGGDDEPARATRTLTDEPVTRLELPETPETADASETPATTSTARTATTGSSASATAALKRDRAYWESRSVAERRAIARAYLAQDPGRARYDPARVAEEAGEQFATSPLKPRTIDRALVEAVAAIATDDLDEKLDELDELTREGQ